VTNKVTYNMVNQTNIHVFTANHVNRMHFAIFWGRKRIVSANRTKSYWAINVYTSDQLSANHRLMRVLFLVMYA